MEIKNFENYIFRSTKCLGYNIISTKLLSHLSKDAFVVYKYSVICVCSI